jgi:hypothetical protein
MINDIAKVQIEIDQFKDQLNSMPEYVFLSGAHALPIHLKTDPYISSMTTGIAAKTGEFGCPQFEFTFGGHVRRHHTEEKDIKKVGGTSNTTLTLGHVPDSGLGLLSEYTDEQINNLCETIKQQQKVEEYIVKKGERDFLEGSVSCFSGGD